MKKSWNLSIDCVRSFAGGMHGNRRNHHGHGRGGGRGHGGRSRNGWPDARTTDEEGIRSGAWQRGYTNAESSRSSEQEERGLSRHPRGLRGRDIGMFYAARSRGRKETPMQRIGYELNVTEGVQSKIMRVLQEFNSRPEASGTCTTKSTNHEFQQDYMKNLLGNMCDNQGARDSEMSLLETLRNPALDEKLATELSDKKVRNAQYLSLLPFREKLPAFGFRTEVTDVIQQNQVTVISGETGSGKTTQIPQFILDRCITDGNGSICNIICTQPRRISTISVSERVAAERGEKIGGNSIGYAIRLERKLPSGSGGTLTFLVLGVLLQRLRRDPFLNGVSHVIVDEVHERDTLSDFTLVILKDLMRKRPDLKVILMSATLNASKFSEYFGGCAIFEIPGFTFPVTQYYLEETLEQTKFVFPSSPPRKGNRFSPAIAEFEQLILPYVQKLGRERKYSRAVLNELSKPGSEEINYDLIQATLGHIAASDPSNGAVLIFVTGWDHITALINQFQKSSMFPSSKFIFHPLHSLIPTATQKEIFNRPPPGIRKVIIATNIAETSITIDDVLYVIDTGRIKLTNYNIGMNMETLDNEWVSRANAQQRRGRAGRVRPGICYHLFSRGRERLLEEYKKPEILRVKLEEPILTLKNLKYGNAAGFFARFMDPPEPTAVDLALTRLRKIGALDSREQLTPLGFHLSKLPMDPYTGKMILMAAIFSCVDPIFSCAASLSFKDCFQMPIGHERKVDEVRKEFAGGSRSDHMATIRAVEGYEQAVRDGWQDRYCYQKYLSIGNMKHLQGMKKEFTNHLHSMEFLPSGDYKSPALNRNSGNPALIKAIIASGLYPNLAVAKARVAKRTGKVVAIHARTHEDGNVKLHPKSVNDARGMEGPFESPFLVYFQKMKSKAVFLHDTTMVTPFPLVFFGGELDYIEDSGFGSLGVDGLTRFRCTSAVYEMIQALRQKLDQVLEDKVRNPGPTNWEERSGGEEMSCEALLLRAIRDLLTTEYHLVLTGEEADDEEEDDNGDEEDVLYDSP